MRSLTLATLAALTTLAALLSTTPAAAEPRLRHTVELGVAGGGWFGGGILTADLRYGFDLIPELQVGAALGARLDHPDPMGLVYTRARLLRGGDEDTFTGHAFIVTVALGYFVDEDYPFIEPSLGWEARLDNGFGVGLDLGLVHSLVDESGWPFARLRVGMSW